jgi:hypothetical protein
MHEAYRIEPGGRCAIAGPDPFPLISPLGVLSRFPDIVKSLNQFQRAITLVGAGVAVE